MFQVASIPTKHYYLSSLSSTWFIYGSSLVHLEGEDGGLGSSDTGKKLS